MIGWSESPRSGTLETKRRILNDREDIFVHELGAKLRHRWNRRGYQARQQPQTRHRIEALLHES